MEKLSHNAASLESSVWVLGLAFKFPQGPSTEGTLQGRRGVSGSGSLHLRKPRGMLTARVSASTPSSGRDTPIVPGGLSQCLTQ